MVEYNHTVQRDEALNRAFRALSDPSRREIIGLMREAGDLRVTDIAKAFSMSLNGVSKHLKVLENANLITRRVSGREHWLQVNWTTLQAAYEWLHFYKRFWSRRLDALADYVEDPNNEKGKNQ